jgi:hypothetical protein
MVNQVAIVSHVPSHGLRGWDIVVNQVAVLAKNRNQANLLVVGDAGGSERLP